MSSPKRRRVSPCDWTTTADSPPPSIPDDLLFARADDATTIVRCAATSKPIRRAVLDPGFLRRRAMANGSGGRLDPAFLVGVSYAFCEKNSPDPAVVSAPRRRRRLRFDARLLHSFVPVASRGGLVVLRQREGDRSASARLLVCNSLTGHTLHLPPATIAAKYPHALLAADDVCFSFQLLVMDRSLRTQIFSPEHGKWGAVVQAHLPPQFSASLVGKASGHPVVLGRTVVHWLCSDQGILALNIGTARATLIDLPPNCLCRVTDAQKREVVGKGPLLAASADGRLSLLVAEYLTICYGKYQGAGPREDGGDDPEIEATVSQTDVRKDQGDEQYTRCQLQPEITFAVHEGLASRWQSSRGLVARGGVRSKAVAIARWRRFKGDLTLNDVLPELERRMPRRWRMASLFESLIRLRFGLVVITDTEPELFESSKHARTRNGIMGYLCSTLEEGKGAVGSAEKKAVHTRKGAFWIFVFNVLL
ncbi:hypothetical protein ACP70R_025533 [Stipagrostis hirtigluma subsp. patula]